MIIIIESIKETSPHSSSYGIPFLELTRPITRAYRKRKNREGKKNKQEGTNE